MDRSFPLDGSGLNFLLERPKAFEDRDLRSIQCSLRSWRQLDGKFHFIIDNGGRILAGEDEFFDRDFAGSDFDRSGGRMRPADRRFQDRFDHLLRCTAPRTALIPKSTDSGHWVCRAVALTAGQSPDHGDGHRLALIIHSAGTTRQVQWADFRTAFGLTQMEDRVLRLMMSGHSAPVIASRQSVSINTVRTHIRHVHEKLGVGDTYELWLRVSDYRIL